VVEFTGKTFDSDIADVSLAIIDLAAPTPAGRSLTKRGTFPETAAWAPDGSRIVFGALDAPGATGDDLFEIRPDGTGLRRITNIAKQGGNATHPDVSADGKSVVFAATLPGESRTVLGLVDLAGGAVRPATGATYIEGVHPRLRPVP
jgi:Tol biopolymer transport system component